jgi:hypothetical protein
MNVNAGCPATNPYHGMTPIEPGNEVKLDGITSADEDDRDRRGKKRRASRKSESVFGYKSFGCGGQKKPTLSSTNCFWPNKNLANNKTRA